MLTGGGDCAGLNPAIRGATMRLLDYGAEVVGFTRGWLGLVEGLTTPLTLEVVEPIVCQGGTILRSSRTNPFKAGCENQLEAVLANLKRFNIDALIAIGGDDTLGVASKLYHNHGVNVIGVPKTMDNDLSLTDYTFGFDSAANVALDAIDRLRDTAKSHDRFIVIEVMGRLAGWVALYSAVASGADWVLLPEVEPDLDAMCEHLKSVVARGRTWGLVVVSEGVFLPGEGAADGEVDAFGHKMLKDLTVGPTVAKEIKRRTGFEVRDVVLGHIVRGGSPSLFDRILGTRVGIKAADMVIAGDFGKMVAIQGKEVLGVPIELAVGMQKLVPVELYESLRTTFNK
jgi:6-phosphofructokinase 1